MNESEKDGQKHTLKKQESENKTRQPQLQQNVFTNRHKRFEEDLKSVAEL